MVEDRYSPGSLLTVSAGVAAKTLLMHNDFTVLHAGTTEVMNTTVLKTHVSAAAINPAGGQVRVFRVVKRRSEKPVLSEQTRRTFEFISDAANAHRFTKEAALKAFAHVQI